MEDIKTVKLSIGGEAKVISKIGQGGQGSVYKVHYVGKEYALKYYHKAPKNNFYENLKNNIEKGAPNDLFLWPLFLTEKDSKGCFGYLMDLRDSAYKEFSSFLLARVQFSSVAAMVEAAVNICIGFRDLHNKGYSYQDLNDGNFFINPQTGHVLICDNDNVAPYGVNTGILGKCRYMAPEIITGNNRPNAQSDRFSLAVILFLLFFNNHPLEGEAIASCVCMTEKHEKKLYGKSPVFIYDPNDTSNRPVRGIHNNVINLWPQFPEYVRTVFSEQFSNDIMKNPQKRQTEKEWLSNMVLKLRDELIFCPSCEEELFPELGKTQFLCENCRKTYTRPPVISSGKYNVLAYADKSVYEYVTHKNSENFLLRTGLVVESKKTPGLFALRNLTKDVWSLSKKDGTIQVVNPNEVAPLLIGNKINFGNGSSANII